MPELPEVESARRLAERHLAGKRILRVSTADDGIVYVGVTPLRFARALKGARVTAVHRKGKYLWMDLDRRPCPVFHFGMTGAFVAYETPAARPRFMKCEFLMEDGTRLAMRNMRRLGRIRLQSDPPQEPPINRLGFDPLIDMPGPRTFAGLVTRRACPIKALLLDQSFIAGIGNWIADEVLYQSKIEPARRANTLSPTEFAMLHRKIRHVITRAVAVDADAVHFPRNWLFHYRWGKNHGVKTYRGEPIRFDTIGGRTTAWVPTVQR